MDAPVSPIPLSWFEAVELGLVETFSSESSDCGDEIFAVAVTGFDGVVKLSADEETSNKPGTI